MVHGCAYVKAMGGMAALLRNSHLQILLHMVPQTKLSLENQGELKAPGPRVVQIHSLQ